MLRRSNRRRWVRYRFDAPVRLLVEGASDASAIHGRCIKMSEGGMSLFALAKVAIGAQIVVEFVNPPSGKPARICGTIRNRLVYLYGVEYCAEPEWAH